MMPDDWGSFTGGMVAGAVLAFVLSTIVCVIMLRRAPLMPPMSVIDPPAPAPKPTPAVVHRPQHLRRHRSAFPPYNPGRIGLPPRDTGDRWQ